MLLNTCIGTIFFVQEGMYLFVSVAVSKKIIILVNIYKSTYTVTVSLADSCRKTRPSIWSHLDSLNYFLLDVPISSS